MMAIIMTLKVKDEGKETKTQAAVITEEFVVAEVKEIFVNLFSPAILYIS
jgi:hypothetical protein